MDVFFCFISVLMSMSLFLLLFFFFFFKQKTAYEMRISDWSSDVCSSDLHLAGDGDPGLAVIQHGSGFQIVQFQPEPVRGLDRNAELLVELCQRRKIGRASCRERVCQYV